ncbi:MAG TPA: hypothetical protein VGP42_01200 [Stellaceae bacterium]|jgi:hypothetical protein|nr:hypothetical protein [Stellaceae bacterium]
MLTGPVPGLPPHQVWAQISDPQKIEYLYRAVEQIWGSLSITGQQLTARFDALERRTKDDLEKLSQRMAALEEADREEG